MTILCKCRSCGAEFVSPNLAGGSGTIVFSGVGTSCMMCGGIADIMDGTYSFHNSKLESLSGPEITLQVARRLGAIVEKAKDSAGIGVDEIMAEIADVSPELAEKIAKHGWGVWALLLLLIWLIKSVELNVTLDVNKAIDQIESYEQTHNPDDGHTEYPIPEDAIINKPVSPTIAEGLKATSPNLIGYRQQAFLAKKPAKDNA